MARIVFAPEVIQKVLDAMDAQDVLKLIDYRMDKLESLGAAQYRCLCPIHKETIFRTLYIDSINKTYSCSYNFCPGNKGGDLVDLYARARGIVYNDALAEIVEKLELSVALVPMKADPAKSLEIAHNLVELNALEEAAEAYRSIVTDDPFNVGAHEGLALVYTRLEDREAAVAELHVLLDIHESAHQPEELLNVAQRLVELQPDEPQNYHTTIETLTELHDEAQLIEYQQRLVDLLDRLGRGDEATDLRMELEVRGLVSLESSLRIIAGLVSLGRVEEAVAAAESRIRRFQLNGDTEGAIACMTALIARGLAPSSVRQAFYEQVNRGGLSAESLGQCLAGVDALLRDGKAHEALELLDGIERRARGNLDYLRARVRVLGAAGEADASQMMRLQVVDRLIHDERWDEASAVVDEILRDDLNNLEAMRRRIEILEGLGRDEQAMEVCWDMIDELKTQDRPADLLTIYEKLTYFEPENAALRQDFISALADAGRRREATLAAVMFADELTASHRVDEAIERLVELTGRMPEGSDLHLKIGDLHLSQSDPEKAAAAFERAAMIKFNQGLAPEGLKCLHRALQADPWNPDVMERYAKALSRHEKTAEAADAYRRLAELFLERNEPKRAEEIMERVFELAPEDTASLRIMARIFGTRHEGEREVETIVRLAQMCLEKRAFGKCLDVVADILKLDPDNVRALELRIDALERSNQVSAAIGACFDLAETLLARGEASRAEPLLRKVVTLDPMSVPAREKLLSLLLKDERHDEAIEIGLELLRAYQRTGQFELARRTYVALTDVAPSLPRLREAALEVEGAAGEIEGIVAQANALIGIYREAGDLKRIADLYRLLLERAPDSIDFRAGLVEVLHEQGERAEQAIHGLKLARLLRAAGRAEESRRRYRDVLTIDRNNEAATVELAELCAEGGHADEATQLYLGLIAELRERGDADAALSLLQKAMRADKRNVALRRLHIDINLDEQRIDEAISAYVNLYELYRSQEMRSKALEILNEAIGVKPDNIAFRRFLIDELRANGRDIEAAKSELELIRQLARGGQLDEAEGLLGILANRDDAPAGLDALRELIAAARRGERVPATGEDARLTDSDPAASNADSTGARRRAGDVRRTRGGEFRRLGPDKPPVQLSLVVDYKFDNFVVSDENEFAHATALAVSKSPGTQYNPLFLWGEVGMGKTHLVNAIALAASEANPGLTVTYTGTEEFISALIEAIQKNSITAFRSNYRATDMLLIDDIQFLSGKERAQEEFFHVFNALFQAGKQIVLTSDRPPRDIPHLEQRLTTRFAAGVIVEIKPPGFEARMAIVRSELGRRDVSLDDEILEAIVGRLGASIRELKGAISQICAVAEVSGGPITMQSATKTLDALYAKAS